MTSFKSVAFYINSLVKPNETVIIKTYLSKLIARFNMLCKELQYQLYFFGHYEIFLNIVYVYLKTWLCYLCKITFPRLWKWLALLVYHLPWELLTTFLETNASGWQSGKRVHLPCGRSCVRASGGSHQRPLWKWYTPLPCRHIGNSLAIKSDCLKARIKLSWDQSYEEDIETTPPLSLREIDK